MERRLVESVPNISEGRDHDLITKLSQGIQSVPSVALLDVHTDPDHHRSVFTIVGEPEAMSVALFELVRQAQQLIDIRQHQGEHLRIGVVDVVPWIPLQGVTMDECVAYSKKLGERVGQELEIPVFLYEEASVLSSRVRLEVIRRGGLAALGTRMKTEEDWRPDYGPPMIHPTAGAIVIGARFFLIAFNVVLHSHDLKVADCIAKSIRSSSGGLPSVKAMAVPLRSRKLVQVSMNLTDYRKTSLRQTYQAVEQAASGHNIGILESEIVGLVPQSAWDQGMSHDIKLRAKETDCILESCIQKIWM